MARKRYNPKTKAAILEAATAARRARKTWKQAFEAAKEAGYTGSVQALVKMMRAAGKVRGRRGRKAGRGPVAALVLVKRGPGRPAKATAGLGSIESMINKLVKEQVNGALDKAIAVLEKAKK
jgi:hypothetical protein